MTFKIVDFYSYSGATAERADGTYEFRNAKDELKKVLEANSLGLGVLRGIIENPSQKHMQWLVFEFPDVE